MLFFTAAISVCIFIALMLNRRNKVIVSICLHFLSIELFLFFSIPYIAKVYQYIPLFDIDTNLFFLLLKPSLPIYFHVIVIIFSICITIYADFILLNAIKKLHIGVKILYSVLIILFVIINLPDVRYSLMLRSGALFYKTLYYMSKPFSVLLVTTSLTIPVIYILMFTRRTRIAYKRFSFNATIVSLYCVDMFELLLFFILPTKHIVPWRLNDFSMPNADFYVLRGLDSSIWIGIIIAMMIVVCVLSFIFSEKPMRFLIKGNSINKRTNKIINENTLMLFHS